MSADSQNVSNVPIWKYEFLESNSQIGKQGATDERIFFETRLENQ